MGKLHDGGNGQQMLVEAGVKEQAVFANRSPDGAAKLLPAIIGLAGDVGLLGVEDAIAQIVEGAAVPIVGP